MNFRNFSHARRCSQLTRIVDGQEARAIVAHDRPAYSAVMLSSSKEETLCTRRTKFHKFAINPWNQLKHGIVRNERLHYLFIDSHFVHVA